MNIDFLNMNVSMENGLIMLGAFLVISFFIVLMIPNRSKFRLLRGEKLLMEENDIKTYDIRYGKTYYERIIITDQRAVEIEARSLIRQQFYYARKTKPRGAPAKICYYVSKEDIKVQWDKESKRYLEIKYTPAGRLQVSLMQFYLQNIEKAIEIFGGGEIKKW